jgi:hypothetical protein
VKAGKFPGGLDPGIPAPLRITQFQQPDSLLGGMADRGRIVRGENVLEVLDIIGVITHPQSLDRCQPTVQVPPKQLVNPDCFVQTRPLGATDKHLLELRPGNHQRFSIFCQWLTGQDILQRCDAISPGVGLHLGARDQLSFPEKKGTPLVVLKDIQDTRIA